MRPAPSPRIAASAYVRAGRIAFVDSRRVAEDLFDRARTIEASCDLLLDADDSPDLAQGMLLSWADRLDEARPLMEGRLRQADEHGDEVARLAASYQLAALEWRAGNWQTAARHAARVDRLHEQTAGELDDAWCLWIGALISASRGELEASRARLESGLARIDAAGEVFFKRFYRWAFGLLELAAGRPEEALRHVEHLSRDLDETGFREHGLTHHVADELEALILVGRSADAERRIARGGRAGRGPGSGSASRRRRSRARDARHAAGQHDAAVESPPPSRSRCTAPGRCRSTTGGRCWRSARHSAARAAVATRAGLAAVRGGGLRAAGRAAVERADRGRAGPARRPRRVRATT